MKTFGIYSVTAKKCCKDALVIGALGAVISSSAQANHSKRSLSLVIFHSTDGATDISHGHSFKTFPWKCQSPFYLPTMPDRDISRALPFGRFCNEKPTPLSGSSSRSSTISKRSNHERERA
jgi:hypothetical protein